MHNKYLYIVDLHKYIVVSSRFLVHTSLHLFKGATAFLGGKIIKLLHQRVPHELISLIHVYIQRERRGYILEELLVKWDREGERERDKERGSVRYIYIYIYTTLKLACLLNRNRARAE